MPEPGEPDATPTKRPARRRRRPKDDDAANGGDDAGASAPRKRARGAGSRGPKSALMPTRVDGIVVLDKHGVKGHPQTVLQHMANTSRKMYYSATAGGGRGSGVGSGAGAGAGEEEEGGGGGGGSAAAAAAAAAEEELSVVDTDAPRGMGVPLHRQSTLGVMSLPIRREHPFERWSPKEVAMFESAMCIVGKQFHEVQEIVQSKSTKEVIEFYYLWKKTSNYTAWKRTFADVGYGWE